MSNFTMLALGDEAARSASHHATAPKVSLVRTCKRHDKDDVRFVIHTTIDFTGMSDDKIRLIAADALWIKQQTKFRKAWVGENGEMLSPSVEDWDFVTVLASDLIGTRKPKKSNVEKYRELRALMSAEEIAEVEAEIGE